MQSKGTESKITLSSRQYYIEQHQYLSMQLEQYQFDTLPNIFDRNSYYRKPNQIQLVYQIPIIGPTTPDEIRNLNDEKLYPFNGVLKKKQRLFQSVPSQKSKILEERQQTLKDKKNVSFHVEIEESQSLQERQGKYKCRGRQLYFV